jgi:hypothetical protein
MIQPNQLAQEVYLSDTSTTLPIPKTFKPSVELRGKIVEHVRADKFLQQIGHVPTPGDPSKVRSTGEIGRGDKKGKRKEREEEVERERNRLLAGDGDGNRERTTQRMVCSLLDLLTLPTLHIIADQKWTKTERS